MSSKSLTKSNPVFPAVLDDFFKPWNEWFTNGDSWSRLLTIPPVNITENKDHYQVSLAVPGMKKDDFKINVDGNILTISSEKEEKKEEKDKKFTRKEYSYTSFCRSFTLPDEVNKEKIDAGYENGVLNIMLPFNESAKKMSAKKIAVK